jgi:phosphohistidine phosphatase
MAAIAAGLVVGGPTAKLVAIVRTLFLMRHAKSSWRDPGIDDHERPLLGKGKRAAHQMAALLQAAGIGFDLVLCSTAARAVETANLLTEALSYKGPLELTARLYLAEPSTYLEVLGELEDSVNRVLVIGHNPGISELVLRLTGQEVDMPTAALAHIELPVDSFVALDGAVEGRLVAFLRPQRDEKARDDQGKDRLRDGKDKKRKGKQRTS